MQLSVNAEECTCCGADDVPLLWVLRDALGSQGTKYGCGVGGCGSCVVLVDGERRYACMLAFRAVAGKSITTIEWFARKPENPVIQAWIAEQVAQCGYGQPAQVLTAVWLLGRQSHSSDAQFDDALSLSGAAPLRHLPAHTAGGPSCRGDGCGKNAGQARAAPLRSVLCRLTASAMPKATRSTRGCASLATAPPHS